MNRACFVLRRLFCLLGLAVGLCLVLAGCAENEPVSQAQAPFLLNYYNGIITSEGKLIFPPGENEYNILLDKQNRQCYVLETEKQLDLENRTSYNYPLLEGCIFRIYDLQGQLQKEIAVQAKGNVDDTVGFYFAADSDLAKSRILVNTILTDGKLQILDCDGNSLLQEQILSPAELNHWQNGYAYMNVTDNFINVVYDLYSNDGDMKNGSLFYDKNGKRLEMPQDYNYIYNIYDEYNSRVSGYYVADYEGTQGQSLYDVLDGDGQVIIAGLSSVDHYADGYFVVQQGFSRGLMDVQGNWIYQESQFVDLED